MAKELENMAKQQFSVENEVNASILTETKQFCQVRYSIIRLIGEKNK